MRWEIVDATRLLREDAGAQDSQLSSREWAYLASGEDVVVYTNARATQDRAAAPGSGVEPVVRIWNCWGRRPRLSRRWITQRGSS